MENEKDDKTQWFQRLVGQCANADKDGPQTSAKKEIDINRKLEKGRTFLFMCHRAHQIASQDASPSGRKERCREGDMNSSSIGYQGLTDEENKEGSERI